MTTPTTPITELSVTQAIRRLYPSLRRTEPVGLVLNTGARRRFECLCGASATCSAKWPTTKAVRQFVAEHNRSCDPRKGP